MEFDLLENKKTSCSTVPLPLHERITLWLQITGSLLCYPGFYIKSLHNKVPLNCFLLPWNSFLQKMEVQSPIGTTIGYVTQSWSPCFPKFAIRDAKDNIVLRIEGPFCTCNCCGDVEFDVSWLKGERMGMMEKEKQEREGGEERGIVCPGLFPLFCMFLFHDTCHSHVQWCVRTKEHTYNDPCRALWLDNRILVYLVLLTCLCYVAFFSYWANRK